MVTVRQAEDRDIAACVALIEERRLRYEVYEPRFWKKAQDSAELSTEWYGRLFADDKITKLVAEVDDVIKGFLIASPFPPPPVYELGGPNALIDDFAVEPGLWQDVGNPLLNEAKLSLQAQGFAQVVVIGARQDAEKTEFLASADLSPASTWWTSGL